MHVVSTYNIAIGCMQMRTVLVKDKGYERKQRQL